MTDDLAAFIERVRAASRPYEAEIAVKAAEIAAAHPDWPAALVCQQATYWAWTGCEPPAPDRAAWGLE